MTAGSALTERRLALGRSPDQRGIDYIEVDRHTTRPGLRVYFVAAAAGQTKDAVPAHVSAASIRITDRSGAPATGIRVVGITRPQQGEPRLDIALRLDDDVLVAASAGEAFTLTLRGVPDVDPFFASGTFSLDRALSNAGGRRERQVLAAREGETPDIEYLVKDYESFRQSMLDQLAVLAPTWTEQGPADMGTAIVEVLAYAADYLSYYQDAVATEAYLGTARQRISVKRHARLLGYALHEGCNARCWVQICVDGDDPVPLDAGTPLLTRTAGFSLSGLVPSHSSVYPEAITRGAEVFETMHPAMLRKAHNRMSLYMWGGHDWRLPSGATRAALAGHLSDLQAGDVLIFEVNEADPRLRHAVRLCAPPDLAIDGLYGAEITRIEWFDEDALPFDLSAATSSVYGNVVLADHGRTVRDEQLSPVAQGVRYQPWLRQPEVVFSQPLAAEVARTLPASAAQVQDPREAVPSIELVEIETNGASHRTQQWSVQPDLLRSDRFACDFTIEIDNRARARLRFGDDVLGVQPRPGSTFVANYRVEGGPRGDIDADSINAIVADDPRLIAARNPLPAEPGLASEPMDNARIDAPQLLLHPRTCIVEQDYVAAARQFPSVLNAVARVRWSGTGYLACIYVQRRGGAVIDQRFAARLVQFLQPCLLAGVSVEIRVPVLVPLDISLRVQVDRLHYRSSVAHALAERFGSAEGQFFHPDAYTFGQTVYLSPILLAAMQVPGVESLDWLQHGRFQRWAQPPRGELEAGQIALGPLEIPRVDGRRDVPSLGNITFELQGGR
jgi:hypothetical protein